MSRPRRRRCEMFKHLHRKLHLGRRDFLKTSTAAAGAALALPAAGLFQADQKTIDGWYKQLATALDKLPNSFPRTKSGIEITVLKKIYLPEEANLAGRLTGTSEPAAAIAKRVGLTEAETMNRLKAMEERGFVWRSMATGTFRLAPFIVGAYEAQLERMDHELAHLVEEYLHQGGIDIMKPQPAIHRVIPAQVATKT